MLPAFRTLPNPSHDTIWTQVKGNARYRYSRFHIVPKIAGMWRQGMMESLSPPASAHTARLLDVNPD
jgi:hypothetical protein